MSACACIGPVGNCPCLRRQRGQTAAIFYEKKQAAPVAASEPSDAVLEAMREIIPYDAWCAMDYKHLKALHTAALAAALPTPQAAPVAADMKLLTDAEIIAIGVVSMSAKPGPAGIVFARAIEAAVIVRPAPATQIRDQALEDAAKAAELEATGDLRDTHYDHATRLCAAAIRAMKGAT